MSRTITTAAALVFLSLGAGRIALADPDLELVSGSDVIFYDGTTVSCTENLGTVFQTTTSGVASTNCAAFGAVAVSNDGTGGESLSFHTFNAWKVQVSAYSNSPNCSGIEGPGCISNDSIDATTAGSTTLDAYFGGTGFNPEPAYIVTESSSSTTGTATAAGYQESGLTGFSATSKPTLSGQIGSTLSLSNCTPCSSGPTGGLSNGDNALVTFNTFAGAAGDSYAVTTTISAVPEPTSMILFGSALLAVTGFAKKKLFRS